MTKMVCDRCGRDITGRVAVLRFDLRDPLREFAEAQEVTLREHDWDRGRLGWRTSDMDFLLHRLKEEVAELEQAIANPRDCYGIMREAVDVANFAMMIWDNARQLRA